MRKKSLIKSTRGHRHHPEMSMNITALMDILTVLLFFLIKSYNVSASSLTPPKDITLPKSRTEDKAEQSIVLAITKTAVLLNNDPIAQLQQGNFARRDIAGDNRTVLPIKKILDQEQKKRLAIYKDEGNLSFLPPGKILIQADYKLPFNVLKYLLHTAAISGYSDYQFVIQNVSPGPAPASVPKK